jgi:glycosyltransferase involved in cell wall biosynthesis
MQQPLRIAFLSEHASPLAALGGQDAGGQNVYVDELTRQLGRLGHHIDVFTRRTCAADSEVQELAPGVRVVHLSVGPPGPLPKDQLWLRMPEFLDAQISFMTREHAHYDAIHSNFWMSGWAAMQLRRRLNTPVVQIFHALGRTKQRFQGADDTSPLGRIAVEHDIIHEVDRLIAQCPSERGELIHDYGADADKIALVPAAVNTRRFRPIPRDEARGRIGLGPDEFVIVYVGRVLPRKDIRNLVEAFALLCGLYAEQEQAAGQAAAACLQQPQPRLVIVGGETPEPDPTATPELGALQRLAHELGVGDRVRFAGRRQPDDLCDFYCAADVAVTTPWYEPFGLTPLEAMACGRPVIGSAVGGLTFTIQDGLTGLLVPPRDPAALALRLHQLMIYPELRVAMGRAARERVEREFTWDLVARRTAELYQTMLECYTGSEPEYLPTAWERAVGDPMRW